MSFNFGDKSYMKIFRRLVLGLALVILSPLGWGDNAMIETIPLSIYIDGVSFAFVVVSCGIIAATSHLSGSTNAFAVLRDIGIPVGLLGRVSWRCWDIAQPRRLRSGIQLYGTDADHRSVWRNSFWHWSFRRRPRPNRKFDSTLTQGLSTAQPA
jgi:hypothetical protein